MKINGVPNDKSAASAAQKKPKKNVRDFVGEIQLRLEELRKRVNNIEWETRLR
jgi:hypothetical protein